jgi:MurNAc alpha-1-phosphate uridylyltransferase
MPSDAGTISKEKVQAADAAATPRHAMVLAAGLGVRMRPLTDRVPKPLVEVAGKTLLDHVLDRLGDAGVDSAVVNVHYLADQIVQHVAGRTRPKVAISDERNEIFGTGGGVVRAMPQLGAAPFFHINSDTIWIEGPRPNLLRLAAAFNGGLMDALLLLAPTATSIGYDGRGDYLMRADGRLAKRPEREVAPFVYAGAAILSPALFADPPAGAFALTDMFARAEAEGRLHGLRLEGTWMHVGTPEAVAQAETAILESTA